MAATGVAAPNEKIELAGAVVTVDLVGSPKGAAVVALKAGTNAVDGVVLKTGGAAEFAPNAVGPPKLKDVRAPAVKLKGVEVLGTAELSVTDGSSVAVTLKGELPVAFPNSGKVNAGFVWSVAATKEYGDEVTDVSPRAGTSFVSRFSFSMPKLEFGLNHPPVSFVSLGASTVAPKLNPGDVT